MKIAVANSISQGSTSRENRAAGREQDRRADQPADRADGEQQFDVELRRLADILAIGPDAGELPGNRRDRRCDIGRNRGDADQQQRRKGDEAAAARDRVHEAGDQAGDEQQNQIGTGRHLPD
jgi:hypothetical protein